MFFHASNIDSKNLNVEESYEHNKHGINFIFIDG